MSAGGAGRISHQVIAGLYHALSWYGQNKSVGKAAVVLNYYSMWRSLHALTVNISDDAWKDVYGLAKTMNISLSGRDDEWLFLFAIETYLHLFVRAVTLSKLGSAAQNLRLMRQSIESMRSIFAPSVFEWVFEAYDDPGLSNAISPNPKQCVDSLLQVLYNLDIAALSVDVFRELYQNILPKSLRKSLGEFYTNEELVDEVLEAIGFDVSVVDSIYRRWRASRDGKDKPLVLDPACGSGTFLVRAIKRVFDGIKQVYGRCAPDIAQFVEETIAGIDINPFAVEMAKLNILLTVSEEMNKCGMRYLPRNIRVYWADSLAVVKVNKNVLGTKTVHIRTPTLAQVLGNGGEILIPLLPNVSSDELIDIVHKTARSGKSFEELLGELERYGEANLDKQVKDELEKLYDAMRKIEEMGNARIVELVKNASVVTSILGRCDYVIGNPPWVRIHRVAPSVMKMLKDNYAYYKPGSAYNPKFAKTKIPFREQHDYSLAFVERGLQFLRDCGVLGYVITSKVLKATYAGKMRDDILSNYKILELRDYSLYPRPLFQDAVNYPLVMAVKKERATSNHKVRVRVANTVGDIRKFLVPQSKLSLDPNDAKSPWLIAPPGILKTLRRIQSESSRLGDLYIVYMGVKTSADGIFVAEEVLACSGGVASVRLAGGVTTMVEVALLNPYVRGESIDPFSYELRNLIIFTHDATTLNPIWNGHQKQILQQIGVLRGDVKVDATGKALVYVLGTSCNDIELRVRALGKAGFQIHQVVPCVVHSCFDILRGGSHVLRLNLEEDDGKCKVSVEGLEIPNHPSATTHFLNHLRELVKRDDYRANLPPWAIFRISPDKFRDYRVAWQEMARHFEVCILPVKVTTNVCGSPKNVIVIPHETVYFINEPNLTKALKLAIYLNSDIARNLIKLWTWTARGGYYRHTSASVAHLPLPRGLLNCTVWDWVEAELAKHLGRELNEVAAGISSEHSERLAKELANALGISDEEYKAIIEYGKWLNETSEAGLSEAEIMAEEEELEDA